MRKMVFSQNVENAFTANNITYDEYKNLLFDASAGRDILDEDGNKVSTYDVNDKIRKVQFDILGIDGTSSGKDIRRAIKKHGVELFEVIEDVIDLEIQKGWESSEFFNEFVETRNLALGDTAEFWVDDETILGVSKVSGYHHDVTLQRLGAGKSFTVPVSTYKVAVGADIVMYLTGRLDWAKFTASCARAFVIAVQNEVFAQIMEEDRQTAIPAAFKGNGALSVTTKKDFDKKIEYVSAANGNSDVCIIGTKTALKSLNALAEVDWRSLNQKEDVARTGRLGTYESTTLIEVPQRIDAGEKFNGTTLKTLVPDNVLLIMPVTGDKFVKFVDFGETEITEVVERGEANGRMDDTMKYEVQRKMGVTTVLGKYHGFWKLA